MWERPLTVSWEKSDGEKLISDHKQSETAAFIRVSINGDADEVREDISKTFDHPMFIERKNRPDSEVAFITAPMKEIIIDEKLDSLSDKIEVLSFIRVL